jgi:N-acetylglucosamine-6-phosphate deacetylase
MTQGYVDLQVNGYAGVDFNGDDLSPEELHAACQRMKADGLAGVLATVITGSLDGMAARLRRLADAHRTDPLVREMIWGFHIEGPFLNETPGYIGAHPAEHARPADLDAAKRLLDAADGRTRLVTLAPERDPGMKLTRFLADQGIIVSAGHCDPSLDELRAALDAGLSMFTHLGNGCPVTLPRHDNIIQRVLSLAGRLWICLIGDGVHVPYFALKNYLLAAGLERSIVVTDAVSPAGLGPGCYRVGPYEAEVGPDMAARIRGTDRLVGAAATMRHVASGLAGAVGLSGADVQRLICENPRKAIDRS